MSSPRTEETEVLVLGAGPVGMFAALRLSQAGLRVRILDQYARTALHSYALALHPQSLRLLDEAGLTAPIAEHAHFLDGITIHHDQGRAEIDFAPVRAAHGGVAVLPQRVLEAALERRLADHGVVIEWGRQLLTFETGPEGVVALVASGASAGTDGAVSAADLDTGRIRATFLVGADGCESMTRRLLRIEQTLAGPPVTVGLMEFDAPMAAPGRMQLVLGADTTDALWPLGPNRGRWSVQLADPTREEEADGLCRRVEERAPWFAAAFGAIDWVTTVSFEQRLAGRFGRGPVWLVGDAARFTSPIGVQSMNVGLREAHDLARRIATILREDGSPQLLDYYNEERQREWKMLLGLKDRIEIDDSAPAWAHETAPRLVRCLPASGHDLNLLLEQVGVRLCWMRGKQRRQPR